MTNLLIDKVRNIFTRRAKYFIILPEQGPGPGTKSESAGYNLHLPVPAYEGPGGTGETLSLSTDSDESGGEAETEHPAIKQGRSSFIKYNSNNKLKPKRKMVNNLSKECCHKRVAPTDLLSSAFIISQIFPPKRHNSIF